MSGVIPPLAVPARVGEAAAGGREVSVPAVPSVPLPVLASRGVGGSVGAASRRFSTALVDASGRVQDRGAVAALGWRPGDRVQMTVLGATVVVCRRAEGVFQLASKPYVVVPAAVRRRCGVVPGSRVLLVADVVQDVLIVHPEHVVQMLLRDFHATLAAEGDR